METVIFGESSSLEAVPLRAWFSGDSASGRLIWWPDGIDRPPTLIVTAADHGRDWQRRLALTIADMVDRLGCPVAVTMTAATPEWAGILTLTAEESQR